MKPTSPFQLLELRYKCLADRNGFGNNKPYLYRKINGWRWMDCIYEGFGMVDQNAFVVNVPTNRTVVVAVRAITDSEVVAHGTKSSSVIKKTEPGIPVLMHIPQPGKTYIY